MTNLWQAKINQINVYHDKKFVPQTEVIYPKWYLVCLWYRAKIVRSYHMFCKFLCKLIVPICTFLHFRRKLHSDPFLFQTPRYDHSLQPWRNIMIPSTSQYFISFYLRELDILCSVKNNSGVGFCSTKKIKVNSTNIRSISHWEDQSWVASQRHRYGWVLLTFLPL